MGKLMGLFSFYSLLLAASSVPPSRNDSTSINKHAAPQIWASPPLNYAHDRRTMLLVDRSMSSFLSTTTSICSKAVVLVLNGIGIAITAKKKELNCRSSKDSKKN
ncbi:hypothetical protein BDB00DRAFT_806828 [Zychaea mexicana]|uniref:uncharacterized protein n=1 Tax=Zychaea mexicana TaxID=64656 RepID=UPI0022FDB496|nr:uncharacterized protein BDB00DRAFT_806828 [Zychaea mexicana]KAI9497112.1 hypothetical protein BDB00DRAFT_806828 [Zychaea mexicana]